MTTRQTGSTTFTEGEWSSMAEKLHAFAGALSSGEQVAFAAHLHDLFQQLSTWTAVADDADVSGHGGPAVYAVAKPWNSRLSTESFLDLSGFPHFPQGWPYW